MEAKMHIYMCLYIYIYIYVAIEFSENENNMKWKITLLHDISFHFYHSRIYQSQLQ